MTYISMIVGIIYYTQLIRCGISIYFKSYQADETKEADAE